jgi:hypothetical protein
VTHCAAPLCHPPPRQAAPQGVPAPLGGCRCPTPDGVARNSLRSWNGSDGRPRLSDRDRSAPVPCPPPLGWDGAQHATTFFTPLSGIILTRGRTGGVGGDQDGDPERGEGPTRVRSGPASSANHPKPRQTGPGAQNPDEARGKTPLSPSRSPFHPDSVWGGPVRLGLAWNWANFGWNRAESDSGVGLARK